MYSFRGLANMNSNGIGDCLHGGACRRRARDLAYTCGFKLEGVKL